MRVCVGGWSVVCWVDKLLVVEGTTPKKECRSLQDPLTAGLINEHDDTSDTWFSSPPIKSYNKHAPLSFGAAYPAWRSWWKGGEGWG